MKLTAPGKEHLEKHYEDLKDKKFFPGLIAYMTSGPVCAMVWEGKCCSRRASVFFRSVWHLRYHELMCSFRFVGKNIVLEGRKMLGATMPSESAMGTIRGDFCIEVGRNICHGSDSVESANKEIALWFPEGVTEWESCQNAWVYE